MLAPWLCAKSNALFADEFRAKSREVVRAPNRRLPPCSTKSLVDNMDAAEKFRGEIQVGRSAALASSGLPHGAEGLTFAAFVALTMQEHDVLPVAVMGHGHVCTFPADYILQEGDRLLV